MLSCQFSPVLKMRHNVNEQNYFTIFWQVILHFSQNPAVFQSTINPYNTRLNSSFSSGFDSGIATSTIKAAYLFGYAVFIIVCLWEKAHLQAVLELGVPNDN